jgi:hypothetical protein
MGNLKVLRCIRRSNRSPFWVIVIGSKFVRIATIGSAMPDEMGLAARHEIRERL